MLNTHVSSFSGKRERLKIQNVSGHSTITLFPQNRFTGRARLHLTWLHIPQQTALFFFVTALQADKNTLCVKVKVFTLTSSITRSSASLEGTKLQTPTCPLCCSCTTLTHNAAAQTKLMLSGCKHLLQSSASKKKVCLFFYIYIFFYVKIRGYILIHAQNL